MTHVTLWSKDVNRSDMTKKQIIPNNPPAYENDNPVLNM